MKARVESTTPPLAVTTSPGAGGTVRIKYKCKRLVRGRALVDTAVQIETGTR
jgi:hypothetical protein